MRENKLRKVLAEKHVTVGAFMDFPSADLVEFTAWIGFDWILIDAEHVGISVETCYNLVRAADAAGIASIVRVPDISAETILAYADSGVGGVIGPHVRNAADAKALVAALRYAPLGIRGAAAGSRAANFGVTQSPRDYFGAVETHPVAMALLEDIEAYDDDLDAIGEVEGLDVFCLGKMDLSISAGVPGDVGHETVQARLRKAAEVAKRNGKILNEAVGDKASVERAIELGSRMLMGSVQSLLGQSGQIFIEMVSDVVEKSVAR
ncbi:siderophore biosynthesis protein SbnG [Nitratireductor mangrovi]|uniref:Siderophore biosynthesis protein SbnG n=1 Tax=Nitratireductor mangrovi TaxID=2599600 RepID=A0A5B8KVK1_9HYPH|nr:aldolase/citrate lyase family protein [Nitratireductor mangrovi]QDY99598.2 siderophore biosynthesis protein SbnG [Nitratireductor mangrovi]